jgi:ribosomal protein L37AE/L43A
MNGVKQAGNVQTGTDARYVCPHCGKTEHTPNAVTIAAMQETEALLRGIPRKHYESAEELNFL